MKLTDMAPFVTDGRTLSDLFFNHEHLNWDAYLQAEKPGLNAAEFAIGETSALREDAVCFASLFGASDTDDIHPVIGISGKAFIDALVEDFAARL